MLGEANETLRNGEEDCKKGYLCHQKSTFISVGQTSWSQANLVSRRDNAETIKETYPKICSHLEMV